MVGTRILLRGHYNPTNWSRKYPNLQKTITPKGEKVLACTTCIKTFTKTARMKVNKEKRAELATIKMAKATALANAPKPAPKAKKPAKPKAEKKEAK
jgi:hypothetical protein